MRDGIAWSERQLRQGLSPATIGGGGGGGGGGEARGIVLLGCLVNIFLTGYSHPSYLPCTKYFGLPVSFSCPVYRNVNDEECLPLTKGVFKLAVSPGPSILTPGQPVLALILSTPGSRQVSHRCTFVFLLRSPPISLGFTILLLLLRSPPISLGFTILLLLLRSPPISLGFTILLLLLRSPAISLGFTILLLLLRSPAISLGFTIFLLLLRSQLCLWGSPFFFFFCVPQLNL